VKRALAISLLVAGCASHAPGGSGGNATPPVPTKTPPPAVKPAPIVLALVVDQLAAWMAAERFSELPKTGGFARLLREGTYARDMRYAHAVTETSPGHAALFTGAAPYRSGIYANESVSEHSGHRQSALRDAHVKTITSDGLEHGGGIALNGIATDTVADVLRAHEPHANIVALSLKDRGAVFAGGKHPDAVIWYERDRDAFVTSTAFSPKFPSWARFMDDDALAALRKDPWTLLDPAFVASHAKQPDAQPGESEIFGFGSTFPHSFSSCRFPPIAFRASPRGDDALFALASAAIEARDIAQPMMLALSLSSYDYIGHFFGPDSWEAWDELLRLDRSLGEFFALLDRKVGADSWSAVLSGDHGGPPLPEAPDAARPWCAKGEDSDFWQRPCRHAGRIFPDALRDALEQAADKALGRGEWILGVASPYVFYTHSAAELPADRRKKLDEAVTKALLAQPEIDRVYPPAIAPCPPESDESIDALACRSLWPANNDALFIVEKKGSFVDTDYDLGRGMSHGGPYLFDRSVPLLVRAPSRAPAGVVINEPISFAAYTRALSAMLGLAPPPLCSDAREIVSR
jgi:hypothetical protein